MTFDGPNDGDDEDEDGFLRATTTTTKEKEEEEEKGLEKAHLYILNKLAQNDQLDDDPGMEIRRSIFGSCFFLENIETENRGNPETKEVERREPTKPVTQLLNSTTPEFTIQLVSS